MVILIVLSINIIHIYIVIQKSHENCFYALSTCLIYDIVSYFNRKFIFRFSIIVREIKFYATMRVESKLSSSLSWIYTYPKLFHSATFNELNCFYLCFEWVLGSLVFRLNIKWNLSWEETMTSIRPKIIEYPLEPAVQAN